MINDEKNVIKRGKERKENQVQKRRNSKYERERKEKEMKSINRNMVLSLRI